MSWEDENWDEPTNAASGGSAPEFSDEEADEVSEDEHAVEESKPKDPEKKTKIKKKTKQQVEAEKLQQRLVEEEAAMKLKAMTPEEIMSEKLRRQKLVEQADNKLTEELFGVNKEHGAKKADGVYDEDTCSATLQTLPLETEEHFQILAKSIAKRLELEQNQLCTKDFLKELVRQASVVLTYEDLMEVDNVISVIKNAKVKTKLNKKKKKVTKKFANVQRNELDDLNEQGGAGGGYDDYDFM